MRIISVTLFLLCAGCFSAAADEPPAKPAADSPQPGEQAAQSLKVKTDDGESTVGYWLFLPKSYDKAKPAPLMLFLHGAGERGDQLDLVKKWGPPKLVPEKKDFPFVLVSPQCPNGRFWRAEELKKLVDHIAEKYAVDKSRIYVTGLSMGGYGTWSLAAKYPEFFAAAIPICGGGDPADAEQLKKTPIWAFHGDQDRAVPLKRSEEMVQAIEKAGGKAKLTVYPEVGHNSWTQTYANPEIYKWLLSHQRK